MTLLWRRGEDLDVTPDRVRAIKADPSAGRAQRDAMLPQFEGLDRRLPRPYRETSSEAIDAGVADRTRRARRGRYLIEGWWPRS